jgi:hypothetical protein
MKQLAIFLGGLLMGGVLYALSIFWGSYQTPCVDKVLKPFDVKIGPLNKADSWLLGTKADLIPIEHPESRRALALLRLQIPIERVSNTTLNLIGYCGGGEIKPVIIDSSALHSHRSGSIWLLLDFGPRVTWKIDNLRLESCN